MWNDVPAVGDNMVQITFGVSIFCRTECAVSLDTRSGAEGPGKLLCLGKDSFIQNLKYSQKESGYRCNPTLRELETTSFSAGEPKEADQLWTRSCRQSNQLGSSALAK